MNDTPWLVLIPLLPLAGFLANGLLRLPKGAAGVVGCAGPLASLALSALALLRCREGSLTQEVFSWIAVAGLDVPFGLAVDRLAAVMLLVVTGVGSLIHIYSIGYMHQDEGFSRFFAYLNLFMFSMLVLVMADSIVLMFFGWEGVGLCSYLLIGFWYGDLRNADAGKKAFITNRLGDFGFLLGIFILVQLFGETSFARLEGKMAQATSLDEGWLAAAGFLLFLGACGKSAQIPLHVWLPDAMAGPTPVSALIHAATMVTAGVYMMARMHFLFVAVPGVLETVAAVAAATALLAALIAVAQTDIKKVLAYSTISQLGFMFVGAAAADFAAGIFHLVTHAFFKALLFLGAGAVIHALGGEQDIRKMGGLARPLRLVCAFFAVGSLALAGFPFSSGFMSKDMILAAAMTRFGPLLSAAMVGTAALTAFYSARLFILVFLGRGDHPHVHKPGLSMALPLAVLAGLAAVGGVGLEQEIQGFLGSWRPREPAGEGARAFALAWSIAAFAVGTLAASLVYLGSRRWVAEFVAGGGRWIHGVVSNKFYVDEIYELLVVAPVRMGATAAWVVVDRLLIDGLLVHGAGRLVAGLGWVLRLAHRGPVNAGAIVFAAGALAVLAYVGWLLRAGTP
jgi:NADH-quinone oxidoreductase subunit L